MKKICSVIFIMIASLIFVGSVKAKDDFWLTNQNMYYQRSQHTYSFTNAKGEYHDSYAPALYVILKDKDRAIDTSAWNFNDRYTLPYTVDLEDYFLVLCADLDVPIVKGTQYNKININDSTYIDESVKSHINGIVKNAYPFISKEAMISNLVEAGVLVERENSLGEKYLTAPTNSVAYNTITADELLSAAQMAIFHFTNKGEVEKNYYSTFELKTKTLVSDTEIGNNIYPKGHYGVVNNNIEAIYNYLITLEGESKSNYIELIEVQMVADDNYFRVTLDKEVTDKDDFTVELSLDGEKKGTFKLNNLERDEEGRYIFKTDNLGDVSNIMFRLIGRNFVENSVDVYEAVGGKNVSQTLVGVSSRYREIDIIYEGQVLGVSDIFTTPSMPEDNPNTTDGIIFLAVLSVILFLLTYGINRKYQFYKKNQLIFN